MLIDLLLVSAGIALLWVGGESLISGSIALARRLGMSPLVVGLTVVAFGTSAPELLVSLIAALGGESDVALGNVVGSNIANIGLILGLSALIAPLRVESGLVRREIPLLILVSWGMVALVGDGRLGRLDGLLLLAGFVGYLVFVLRSAHRAPPAIEAEFAGLEYAALAGSGEVDGGRPREEGRRRDAVLVILGIATLAVGAHLMVDAAVWFARRLGVSELLVGLTLVAVGTSLPELATSAVAALRRQADIAVGNIVGSNVFNVLAILGLSGVLRPLESHLSLLRFELPVMGAAAVLLLPLAWSRFEIQRWEGAVLLSGYAVFLWVLVVRAAGVG